MKAECCNQGGGRSNASFISHACCLLQAPASFVHDNFEALQVLARELLRLRLRLEPVYALIAQLDSQLFLVRPTVAAVELVAYPTGFMDIKQVELETRASTMRPEVRTVPLPIPTRGLVARYARIVSISDAGNLLDDFSAL